MVPTEGNPLRPARRGAGFPHALTEAFQIYLSHSLFKEKDKFVELYKSLSGIELDSNDVESFDLDSLVISDWHNDVSFVTKDKHIIILLEQQSSYCANMSIRCLVYYSNLVRKLYEDNMDKFKNKIYSKNKLFLLAFHLIL